MHDNTRQVEEILARLMPVALSDGCQSEVDALIDELAAGDGEPSVRRSWWKYWVSGGIAAAGAIAALLFNDAPLTRTIAQAPAVLEDVSGLVLVSERNRVESMSDEGWVDDLDGSAMQATRLNVVEENTVRDAETGLIFRISEPREEVLLMPVSTF